MNTRQIGAIFLPFLLIMVMIPIFQGLARQMEKQKAWFTGLVIYWILWGIAAPLLLVGKSALCDLIQPSALNGTILLLASIPVLFAGIGRVAFGMQSEKPEPWIALALIGTALGNGIFEEILWRGVYLTLFPDHLFLQIIWPSLWFGLWHYAPGSISQEGNPFSLMTASVFLGLLLSFLGWESQSIFWPVLAHTLAGLVMVL
jgi:hypothetical protein